MRLFVLAMGLVVMSAAGLAFAEQPGTAPEELPRTVSCEAGFEESFGDRPAQFYTVEVDRDPRVPKPTALFTRWMNAGLRPYYGQVAFQRRFAGELQRHGAGLMFAGPGWTLVVAPDNGAQRLGELRISGRKLPARCSLDPRREPATPAVELMRSAAFQQVRAAARDALSDDYQLLYGPIVSVAAGDRLSVEVALRKVRSHVCGGWPAGRRLPFAKVLATLARAGDVSRTDGTSWDIEQIELKITDPTPPAENTPSADEIASAIQRRYGAASTFEARFRLFASSHGIFASERSAGLLRADTARGVSVRKDDYRQLELAGRSFRYTPIGRPSRSLLSVVYQNALPFLGAALGEHFDYARTRSIERCAEEYVLLATPKRQDPSLERLFLFVDRSTFSIRRVSVATPASDYVLELTQQNVGAPLPDGEFDPVPPPGYELARAR